MNDHDSDDATWTIRDSDWTSITWKPSGEVVLTRHNGETVVMTGADGDTWNTEPAETQNLGPDRPRRRSEITADEWARWDWIDVQCVGDPEPLYVRRMEQPGGIAPPRRP